MQEIQRNLKHKAPTPFAGEYPETVANEQSQKIEAASKDIPPAARCPLVLLDASLVTLELVTKRFWVAAAQQYVSSVVVFMHLPQNLPAKEHVRRLSEVPLITKPIQNI